tara:strand:+ start:5003 stop:5980 length:978 start_codon:yes stop_codon:yes gene_type:complete
MLCNNNIKINIDYKRCHNYEEMITIYHCKNKTNYKQGKPIFIFIMGSAWMGYFPLLYYITNYWNSSIMKNLSFRGYTCISIRHRGTFIKPISLKNTYIRYLMIILFFTNILLFINFLLLVSLWNIWTKYSVDYNTIINDVEDSLNYINLNYDNIHKKYNTNGNIILAGYSSGVQVLNQCLIKNNFKNYDKFKIKNIIYISGVLNLFENINKNSLKKYTRINRIIYNFLILLFSKFDIDNNLITPYNSIDNLPILEYYIFGCKHEFLNIPFVRDISEHVFCGKKYHEKFNSGENTKKSYYIEFDKNHWNILNSTLLCNAIVNILEK